jgi:hypothetical protein
VLLYVFEYKLIEYSTKTLDTIISTMVNSNVRAILLLKYEKNLIRFMNHIPYKFLRFLSKNYTWVVLLWANKNNTFQN